MSAHFGSLDKLYGPGRRPRRNGEVVPDADLMAEIAMAVDRAYDENTSVLVAWAGVCVVPDVAFAEQIGAHPERQERHALFLRRGDRSCWLVLGSPPASGLGFPEAMLEGLADEALITGRWATGDGYVVVSDVMLLEACANAEPLGEPLWKIHRPDGRDAWVFAIVDEAGAS